MGCHTWTYIRFKPDKEKLQQCINEAITEIDKYLDGDGSEECIRKAYDNYNKAWADYEYFEPPKYEEWKEDYLYTRQYLTENNTKQKILQGDYTDLNGWADTTVLTTRGTSHFIGAMYHNGEWYEPYEHYNDIFRVSHFPEDKFTDADTLITWLEKRQDFQPNDLDEMPWRDRIRKCFEDTEGLLFKFG